MSFFFRLKNVRWYYCRLPPGERRSPPLKPTPECEFPYSRHCPILVRFFFKSMSITFYFLSAVSPWFFKWSAFYLFITLSKICCVRGIWKPEFDFSDFGHISLDRIQGRKRGDAWGRKGDYHIHRSYLKNWVSVKSSGQLATLGKWEFFLCLDWNWRFCRLHFLLPKKKLLAMTRAVLHQFYYLIE